MQSQNDEDEKLLIGYCVWVVIKQIDKVLHESTSINLIMGWDWADKF